MLLGYYLSNLVVDDTGDITKRKPRKPRRPKKPKKWRVFQMLTPIENAGAAADLMVGSNPVTAIATLVIAGLASILIGAAVSSATVKPQEK